MPRWTIFYTLLEDFNLHGVSDYTKFQFSVQQCFTQSKTVPVQGVHIQCSPVFQGVGMDLLGAFGEKEALGFKGDMNVQTSSVIAINAVLLMVVNSRAITPNLSTQRKSPKTI